MNWQPIETAPKDGACIVAVATDDGWWLGRLDRNKKGQWLYEGEPTFCLSYYFEPKWWQNLPEQPKEKP